MTSLEISKQLYEVSGWDSDTYYWLQGEVPSLAKQDNYPTVVFHNDSLSEYPYAYRRICPAYDSDYLLEKLPPSIEEPTTEYFFELVRGIEGEWLGIYRDVNDGQYTSSEAYTPSDCLALLAIELFKSGVLVKESK